MPNKKIAIKTAIYDNCKRLKSDFLYNIILLTTQLHDFVRLCGQERDAL